MLTEPDLDRIVFGCGNFGGIGSSPSLRSAGDSEDQALRLLDHARRVGLRRFDTANTYGGGASEKDQRNEREVSHVRASRYRMKN